MEDSDIQIFKFIFSSPQSQLVINHLVLSSELECPFALLIVIFNHKFAFTFDLNSEKEAMEGNYFFTMELVNVNLS